MPVVSVIIPVFNCADTLSRAIESAQKQTLRDIEIVVVDDCSTDGSFAVAQKLAQSDPRIKAVQLPQNGGASVARNAAIDMAAGDWVAVLDADDWYETQRLEKLLRVALENNAELVCDNLKIYDHVRALVVEETRHGVVGKASQLGAAQIFNNDNPLLRHAIGYIKPMVKRDFLKRHSIRYDPIHRNGQDFVWLAEIVLSGARSFIIPDAMYVYVHRISPTTRKISPHSRSGARFNLIVQGCDQLLAKYNTSMDADTRRALERRRFIFENRVMCGEMIDAVREKNYGAALGILATRPFIFVLLGATAFKLLYANLRYKLAP